MEHLCPNIDQLVSCYTCGAQSLPPYRLCMSAHVGCPPCVEYLPRCACGDQYTCDPHTTFDWLVFAMKLRCKYRKMPAGDFPGQGTGDGDCGDHRWYGIQELREHYRTSCMRNVFGCPLNGCGHMARVETIVDHYETAHGPFEALKSSDEYQPRQVTFTIPSWTFGQMVRKIFNGYFLFVVSPRRIRGTSNPPRLSMQNINPSDPLQYEYTATMMSSRKELKVTVSIVFGLRND